MDEYEKLEEDLQRIYDEYMLKFRNQTYLENVLDEYQKAEGDANEVDERLSPLFIMFYLDSDYCHQFMSHNFDVISKWFAK